MNFFVVIIRSIRFAWSADRTLFAVLILVNIVLTGSVYIQFYAFSWVVDEIVNLNRGFHASAALTVPLVILGGSFLLPSVLNSISVYLKAKFKMHQANYLDLLRVEKQGSLDIGTLESNSYQNLLRSAHEWGSKSISTIQDFVLASTGNISGILISMFILWTLNNWLIIFAALAATPIYFLYKKYSKEIFNIRWSSIGDHRMIVNRTSHFEELHKAVDLVLLGLKDLFKSQLENCKDSYTKKSLNAERKKTIGYSILSLWYLIFLFAALIVMTGKSVSGAVGVGALILAFNTYTRFYQTLNSFIESVSVAEDAALYAARWLELFELKPMVESKSNAVRFAMREQPPFIEFRNVSFQYPHGNQAERILKNVNFTIKPGQRIAIVGTNGSGKTTLIKLLCRVYDPTEGNIFINGVDLKDLNLRDWHNSLGVLFQDFPAYNMTIKECIAIGRVDSEINEGKLHDAAVFSGADEFINDFPEKFDQLIWQGFEGGTELSKGQQQRLAVARMFYRNAPVTILDEPTASVDAITEEKIFSMLERNSGKNTVILITHRFSTVKSADSIILLEKGKIIQMGPHEKLMQNPKYAAFYALQAKHFMSLKAGNHTAKNF